MSNETELRAALERIAQYRGLTDHIAAEGMRGIATAALAAETAAALQPPAAESGEGQIPAGMPSLWRPISELADIYQQPVWIASPKLLHGDSNPLGIAEAYWQDTDGPEEGEWRTTSFDMCQDEWDTITLAKEDVTHFLIPEGPWSEAEAQQLESVRATPTPAIETPGIESGTLPDDVARLVIAARIVAWEDPDPESLKELQDASEAFSERVAWEDQPGDVA